MRRPKIYVLVGLFTVAYWGSSTDPQYPLLLVDFLHRRFGVGTGVAALPIVAASLCACIGTLSAGFLSRRLGIGTLIYVCLWGFVICSGLNTIDASLALFVVTRGLTGLFQGGLSLLFLLAVGVLVPESHRGRAVGVLSAGAMFAVAAVPLLVKATQPPGDLWHFPFWVFGGAALIGVLGLHLVRMPLRPQTTDEVVSPWPLLREPRTVWLLLLGGLLLVSIVAMASLFPSFAHDSFGLELSQLMPHMLTLGAGAVVGALLAGRLTDRLGPRVILVWSSVAVTGFFLTVAPLARSVLAVYPVFCLMSALAAARVPPYQALMLTVIPENARGPILSIRNMFSYLGTATGAGLGGLVYQHSGSYLAVAVLAAAFSALALWLIACNVPRAPTEIGVPAEEEIVTG